MGCCNRKSLDAEALVLLIGSRDQLSRSAPDSTVPDSVVPLGGSLKII